MSYIEKCEFADFASRGTGYTYQDVLMKLDRVTNPSPDFLDISEHKIQPFKPMELTAHSLTYEKGVSRAVVTDFLMESRGISYTMAQNEINLRPFPIISTKQRFLP